MLGPTSSMLLTLPISKRCLAGGMPDGREVLPLKLHQVCVAVSMAVEQQAKLVADEFGSATHCLVTCCTELNHQARAGTWLVPL